MNRKTASRALTVILTAALLLGTLSAGNAATAGNFGHIKYLLVNTQGVFIYTDEPNKPNPNNCPSADRYVLGSSHSIFSRLYALLLTAYSKKGRIKVWVDNTKCKGNAPSVWSLQLERW